ncbi:unnamed protein product [Protopolystoma xenopodis]|uniref:Uncharacterized protein n=1 Tax=Protopolystoma xenopodis TaxID=117903 RepID=A0A448WSC4_9PLAT|nr:unnamed protein product [Protopolystoma xenopodis]
MSSHIHRVSKSFLIHSKQSTNKGLSFEVKEGDYNGLVATMGHLGDVKERQAATDELFEPLKQTIELLKTYNQEMSEDVHQSLEVSFSL